MLLQRWRVKLVGSGQGPSWVHPPGQPHPSRQAEGRALRLSRPGRNRRYRHDRRPDQPTAGCVLLLRAPTGRRDTHHEEGAVAMSQRRPSRLRTRSMDRSETEFATNSGSPTPSSARPAMFAPSESGRAKRISRWSIASRVTSPQESSRKRIANVSRRSAVSKARRSR